ncbi:MAG: GntR family transcriptional regulator, partial [Gammaproteobacteria bacterium]|nr:GntR family transcriptional regulator [Gammaproteobacteria bacterium]
ELAQRFGISRGPLREAIQRLEGSKLVLRIPRSGVRVVTLDEKMMTDIYVVREALEGMSARLAAKSMPNKEIDNIWKLLDQHQQNIEQAEGKNYFQKEGDLDFHYRIALNSQNNWLLQLLGSELYQLLRICRQRSSKQPLRPIKALNEHHMIMEAISSRDEELAEMLMRRHISGAWQIVKETLL